MRAPVPAAIITAVAIASGCAIDAGELCEAVHRSPTITSIEPAGPKPGDLITIKGAGFGHLKGTNWVRVDMRPTNDRPIVERWTDTEIRAHLHPHMFSPDAELSVVVGPHVTRPVALPMSLERGPVAEFTKPIDLGLGASEAFDVIGDVDCMIPVVGRVADGQGFAGFFARLDEFGNLIEEYTILSEKVSEWRAIAKHPQGYTLIGTSKSGGVALLDLDPDGKPTGGPSFALETGKHRVHGAVHDGSQIAVVGDRGEVGFLARYNLENELVGDRSIEYPELGVVEARSISSVTGNGFAIAGRRTAVDIDGKTDHGWVEVVDAYGETVKRRGKKNARFDGIATAPDPQVLAVGDSGDRGFSTRYEIDGVVESASAVIGPSIDGLNDVIAVDGGYLAAGFGREDGVVARLDCAGGKLDATAVDAGGSEVLHAVNRLPVAVGSSSDRGYLVAGVRGGVDKDIAIVGRVDPFEIAPPQISFSIAGAGPDIELSDPCIATGCGPTSYKLTAVAPGSGRCEQGLEASDTVEVFILLDPKWTWMVHSAAVVIGLYGEYEAAGFLLPAHVDQDTPAGPQNRCIKNMGLPYGPIGALWNASQPAAGSQAFVDDRVPGLVTYTADSNNAPDRFAMAGFGGWLIQNRPRLIGAQDTDYIAPVEWEAHWGGWHTGDGGMALVTPTEPGPATKPGWDWKVPDKVPPTQCGSRDALCGAKFPWIWHPALWDVHIWYPQDGTLPRVKFMSPDAGLPNPCEALDGSSPVPELPGCDSGSPSLGITPFFKLDADGALIEPFPACME